MIPLAIVMETADSGGCHKFWHPPLSAYAVCLFNVNSTETTNIKFIKLSDVLLPVLAVQALRDDAGSRKTRKNKKIQE
ncbi:MAG: hypothetical protein IJR84_05975, partial [Bacteroidaceae bacterium]|nr:hypothetical protein [Bacteroidaceae bacterium]